MNIDKNGKVKIKLTKTGEQTMEAINIKDKVAEINKYFCDKLIMGEYDIIDVGKYTTEIKISNYKFDVWTSSNPKLYFNFHHNYNDNNIKGRALPLLTTPEQIKQAFKAYKNHPRIKALMPNLNRLNEIKEEIEKLEKQAKGLTK